MAAAILLYIIIIFCGVIGWLFNLIDVISLIIHHAPMDALFVGRIIGVPVFAIGAVLGWF